MHFYRVGDGSTDGVLERLASFEGGDLHRRDGNLLAGVPRVHARTCGALADAEGAEARDRHGIALLELLRDHHGHCLKGIRGGALRDARGVRDVVDQVLLGHKRREKVNKKKLHRLVYRAKNGLCKPFGIPKWLLKAQNQYSWLLKAQKAEYKGCSKNANIWCKNMFLLKITSAMRPTKSPRRTCGLFDNDLLYSVVSAQSFADSYRFHVARNRTTDCIIFPIPRPFFASGKGSLCFSSTHADESRHCRIPGESQDH